MIRNGGNKSNGGDGGDGGGDGRAWVPGRRRGRTKATGGGLGTGETNDEQNNGEPKENDEPSIEGEGGGEEEDDDDDDDDEDDDEEDDDDEEEEEEAGEPISTADGPMLMEIGLEER